MWILIQIKAVFVALFLLIFVLLPACLIAAPFNLRRRLKIVSPAWAFFARNLLKFGCHTRVTIDEDHRSEAFATTPPFGIYIANHQSYVDIPLIITKYQLPPIMKKEVLYIPLFGQLGWISGALPVSRSKVGSRKKVFDAAKKRILGEKIGIQVYPEGTRSKQADPKAFSEIKRTLMIFAFNEKIPVIPTSIYGTRGVLTPSGTINPYRHVGIIVHKEIDPKDFASADSFCEACWAKVTEGYQEMKTQLGPLNERVAASEMRLKHS
jgi:1-acyl-sn-glycerol-3-phosphate acyltransferase